MKTRCIDHLIRELETNEERFHKYRRMSREQLSVCSAVVLWGGRSEDIFLDEGICMS